MAPAPPSPGGPLAVRQLSNRAGQRRGGVLSAAERRGALFEALTKTVRSDAARGEVLTLMYEAAAGNDEEAAPMQWPTKEGSHAAEARKAAAKDKAKRGGKGEAEEKADDPAQKLK